jgi:hypothetical protein
MDPGPFSKAMSIAPSYLLDRGGRPARLTPEPDHLLGWDATGEPINLPKPARVVDDLAGLTAALAAGGLIYGAQDTTIDLPSLAQMSVPGTVLIGLPGFTMRSTYVDTNPATMGMNHCLWMNANDCRVERVHFTSIHGAVFDGFTPVTQSGVGTNDSPVITGLADTSVLEVGLFATGFGIIAVVQSIDSPTQITLDRNVSDHERSIPERITFRKNFARHIGVLLPCSDSYAVKGLTIRDCKFSNLFDAIHRSGGPTGLFTEDLVIEGNEILDFYNTGILFNWNVRRVRIHRNRILGRSPGQTHSTVQNCVSAANGMDEFSIKDNEFGYSDRMGCEIPFTVDHVDLSHNWSHDHESMGLSFGYGRNATISHNIVEDVKGIGIEIAGSYESSPSRSYVVVDNNIIRRVAPEFSICVGLSITQIAGVVASHNEVADIEPALSGTAIGIDINGSFEVSVIGNYLKNAGGWFIASQWSTQTNIADNQMVSTAGYGNANAVALLHDATTYHRVTDNVSHSPTGQTLTFYNAAKVEIGGGVWMTAAGLFRGSNVQFDSTTGVPITA